MFAFYVQVFSFHDFAYPRAMALIDQTMTNTNTAEANGGQNHGG